VEFQAIPIDTFNYIKYSNYLFKHINQYDAEGSPGVHGLWGAMERLV
jgi:hypothetical protein